LEARIATLGVEIAQMREILSAFTQKKSLWLLKVAAVFENDPTFDEVTRHG